MKLPAPIMSALALLAFASLAVLPACQADDDVCVAAVSMSDSCGAPLTKDQCKKMDSKDAQALLTSLTDMRCSDSDGQLTPTAATCKLAGWPCPDAIGPTPTKSAPRYPVVFVGGIDGHAELDWNPALLSAVADATGAHVIHATLPSWASREERASALWSTLEARGAGSAGQKFNLVCYAVGGLDCRALVSPKGIFADDAASLAQVTASIASVTTIATPHRGTRVADAAVIALQTGTQADLVKAVTGVTIPGSIGSGALVDALQALTLDGASRASAKLTDANGVYYQSFAGVSHMTGDADVPRGADVLAACGDTDDAKKAGFDSALVDHMQPTLIVTAPFGGASMKDDGQVTVTPTDGMVSVDSAKWGHFRGCIPADHYHVIGQLRRSTKDVYTGFDAARFYGWLANDLAGRGL